MNYNSDSVDYRLMFYANKWKEQHNRYMLLNDRQSMYEEHMGIHAILKQWWEQREGENKEVAVQEYLKRKAQEIPNRGYLIEGLASRDSQEFIEVQSIVRDFVDVFLEGDKYNSVQPFALEFVWVGRTGHANKRVTGYKETRLGDHSFYLSVNVTPMTSPEIYRPLRWGDE